MVVLIASVVTSDETKAEPSLSNRTNLMAPAENFLSRLIFSRMVLVEICSGKVVGSSKLSEDGYDSISFFRL